MANGSGPLPQSEGVRRRPRGRVGVSAAVVLVLISCASMGLWYVGLPASLAAVVASVLAVRSGSRRVRVLMPVSWALLVMSLVITVTVAPAHRVDALRVTTAG